METGTSVYAITQRKLDYMLTKTAGGAQKALLADLRRGVGSEPGALPKLWGIFLEGLPDSMTRQNGCPTKEEWAIYIAITLFALHQQGSDPQHQPMHIPGQKFGKAMAQLVTNEEEETRILRRFNMIATSGSIEELSYHLRGAIQLLRSKGIPLDYADLARDLYDYQSIQKQNNVRLKWGQDFYQERGNYQEEGENTDE